MKLPHLIRKKHALPSYFVALMAGFFAFCAAPVPGKACNLSSFTLNSIVPMGLDTAINFTICIGSGKTGALNGGDQSTNSIFVEFWGTYPGTVIQSFSPSNFVSGFGGCVNPGVSYGPDPSFGSIASIIFIDPGYYGFNVPCSNSPLGCVNSTALCGNVTATCRNFTVVVNHVPDSMCVLGVEGGGNPTGGCPCSQMGSALRQSALGLLWGDISAVEAADHIRVTWMSLQEFGMGTHHLERQMYGSDFMEIASMPGAGANQEPVEYKYLDSKEDLQGEVNYRVRFVDENGKAEYSTVVSVKLPITGNFFLRHIFPTPAHDVVNAEFICLTAGNLDWKMIDIQGKSVASGIANLPEGQSSLSFDLSQLRPGTYYMQCRVGNERVTRKVVKL